MYEITFKDRTIKSVDAVKYELTGGWFLFYWPTDGDLIYQVDAADVMAIERIPPSSGTMSEARFSA